MKKQVKGIELIDILKPYKWFVLLLLFFSFSRDLLSLFIPKIVATTIDSIGLNFSHDDMYLLLGISFCIFIMIVLQFVNQVYLSEKVAKDMRNRIIKKISKQDYDYIERVTASKILTNLTSDVDAIKTFASSTVPSILSSIFLIIGASLLLLSIDWQLAILVFMFIPFICIVFYYIISRVHYLFKAGQEALDKLNSVLNETIIGSMLIRILNCEKYEKKKFKVVNNEAKNIGVSIVKHFSFMHPAVNFIANLAAVTIVAFGGYQVIETNMTIGDFTAFNSYLLLLILPILILSFMINMISQASVSYQRIREVLLSEESKDRGRINKIVSGKIEVQNLTIEYEGRKILDDISFSVLSKTKTAIIGPTAGGKTQLIYALIGLIKPRSGNILYDDVFIEDYKKKCFYKNIGTVFQDSAIFNLTIKENIAFSNQGNIELRKAIETAELEDFISSLPDGLNTVLSERGSNLSGGQKQRIALARALASNPRVLFLDDFTARVDQVTEKKILGNIEKNYPEMTIISVTQKIDPVVDYDNIILIMEGKVVAMGKHSELIKNSLEYCQIYNSQKSTNQYELHTES